MLDISTAQGNSETTASEIDVIDAIRAACARELSPLVQKIDKEGLYPESVMRELGRLGAFAHHLPDGSDNVSARHRHQRDGGGRRILSVDIVLHVVSGRARLVHLRIR